ncbi:MAG TPA: hypothetical protein VJP45_07985 [Candidatus Limnocylindria bacterium]|nr:hypothetical protein [Candidatus Limnocylindria bacterium]
MSANDDFERGRAQGRAEENVRISAALEDLVRDCITWDEGDPGGGEDVWRCSAVERIVDEAPSADALARREAEAEERGYRRGWEAKDIDAERRERDAAERARAETLAAVAVWLRTDDAVRGMDRERDTPHEVARVLSVRLQAANLAGKGGGE